MKIEDNFLGQSEFDKIQEGMMGYSFPWEFYDFIDNEYDKDKFQFTHFFYSNSVQTGDSIQLMNPILEVLNPVSLYRIKANLLTRLPTIVENTSHIDMSYLSEEKLKQWTTSIFYVNTNNGYTVFEDGTKVESIANRMLTFPANMKHTGTSCTDENIRIVINFNYSELPSHIHNPHLY